MDSVSRTVVKLGGPADIVGLMPYRVGFHPTESVVVMCLDGPRRRTGMVARHDLPPPHAEGELAALLGAHVRRNGAAALVILVYTEEDDVDGDLPRRDLVDALREESGAEVLDALLVRSGRWWSYDCEGTDCCSPSGTAIPPEPEGAARLFAAELAAEGRAVLPDRSALEASIRPPLNAIAREARQQSLVAADLRVCRLAEHGGTEGLRDEVLRLLRSAAQRWAAGSRELDRVEVALILLGLHDKTTRDEAAVLALHADQSTYLALLVELCRHALPEDAAPICTVLAWVSHLAGDGALANVAVERALRCDPDYVMAALLQQALQAQIPPREVRKLMVNVRQELDRIACEEDPSSADDRALGRTSRRPSKRKRGRG